MWCTDAPHTEHHDLTSTYDAGCGMVLAHAISPQDPHTARGTATQCLLLSLDVVVGPAETMLHGCISWEVCKHAVRACMRKHCISVAVLSLQAD